MIFKYSYATSIGTGTGAIEAEDGKAAEALVKDMCSGSYLDEEGDEQNIEIIEIVIEGGE